LESSERSKSINFLDLVITFEDNYKLSTRLYEKKENLYLYLPANSAHSPGNLKGLIYGMIYRTLNFTSSKQIQRLKIRRLYNRLIARGYKPSLLKQMIEKAYKKITNKQDQHVPKELSTKREHLFYNTYYHPNDPPSSVIQKHFRNEMLYRLNRPNLPDLKNQEYVPIGIK
jgi:hypothetical protein